jgi:hypothetical protein
LATPTTPAPEATIPRGNASSYSPTTKRTPPTRQKLATERFPHPGNWTAPGCGTKRSSLLAAEGADINTQLAQARELEAKLAEEYRAVRLLRASIVGEASARGERARELGKQARECINADFNVDDPNTPPRASQKLVAAAAPLRAMPAPSTPEARNLHREA